MKRLPLAIALSATSLSVASCSFNQSFSSLISGEEPSAAAQTQPLSPANALVSARGVAWEAALLVQRPPHSADTWQQAKVKWRQAIRLLEAIPDNTPISAQARKRLAIYKSNYQAISHRLATEEAAVEVFEQAQTLAWQAAVTVQNPPHPLKVWRRANQKWEEALSLLASIPPMTSVSKPAKERLTVYQNNYKTLRERIEIEQKGQLTLRQFSTIATRLSQTQTNALQGQTTDPLGIDYQTYRKLTQSLRTTLATLDQQPSGKQHLAYQDLAAAIADYEFALDIWQTYLRVKQANAWYLHNDDLYNQLIPLSQIDSKRLLKNYQVNLYQGAREAKVPLKFTVWEIWEQAERHVNAAHQKMNRLN